MVTGRQSFRNFNRIWILEIRIGVIRVSGVLEILIFVIFLFAPALKHSRFQQYFAMRTPEAREMYFAVKFKLNI